MIDGTPLLHVYAAYRRRQLARQDPPSVQERVLKRLVDKAAKTRFGLDHGFDGIRSVADFQARVPLRRFEDMWADYWQPSFPRLVDCTWPGTIPFFAVTSGTTTGETKHIPCSRDIIANHRMATMDLIVHHLHARPRSRLFGGKNFMLGGSTAMNELAPGIHAGDLSGIMASSVPWWAAPFYYPPRDLQTITDWEERIDKAAPASLEADIRAIGGTPSWLLLFFDKLAKLRPEKGRRLASFYPNLEMVVHGGVNFAPYRGAFATLLDGSNAETREVYPASEGFIAVADLGDGEGLRMVVDQGVFFEFVPVDEVDSPSPTRHWLATAEVGVNYALLLSTCAGLWSYVIGDTVRLVERHPARLLITGRTTYSLSAFGEHLIGEEIDDAIAAAARTIAAEVTDYAVGAVFPDGDNAVGGHLFIVEFETGDPGAKRTDVFREALDRRLAERNEDYRVHRKRDYGMRRPSVHAVPPGTFAAWMKSRGKFGGQNKVPRVINKPELFADLRSFVGRPAAPGTNGDG
jgi:GH3 auxin-responsive promoter